MEKITLLASCILFTSIANAQTAPLATKPDAAKKPTVGMSMSRLSADEQKRFTASAKLAGIKAADLQGMDVETALKTIQSQRAQLLDNQFQDQIAAVQAKNKMIANLNRVLSSLNKAAAGFPANAKPNMKVGDTSSYRNNDYQLEQEINNALMDADIPLFSTAKALPNSGQGSNKPNTHYDGGINRNITKGELDTAIQQLKSQIDSLNNSQQMDMLRLQSLANKRNQAFDTTADFLRKMQESRTQIIGNMR